MFRRSPNPEPATAATEGQRLLVERALAVRPPRPVAQPSAFKADSTRTSERFVPKKPLTYVTLRSGKKANARVINMSRLGAAVELGFAIKPDEIIQLGSRRVTAGRRIAVGLVLIFERPLTPAECRPEIDI